MQLIICEKPKVAEKVARALSEGAIAKKRFGRASYFVFSRKGKEVVVAPSVGHVFTLVEKTKGGNYPVFDVEWAPTYMLGNATYSKDYVNMLAHLAKRAEEYINSCDYDIEGSLIGYNIMRFLCGEGKRTRMRFSMLTSEELVKAYENRGELDVLNAVAGETRHYIDWFYGINWSRALMSALQSAGIKKVLSIGRVQGPTLKILTQREREIAAFVPTPYWQVVAVCRGVEFLHEKEKFERKEDAVEVKNRSKNPGKIFEVKGERARVPPLPPFDLTSLQVEAYRCFGFSPEHTLELAQSLYENSAISYPRTASQKLPRELGLANIIGRLSENPEYAPHAKSLIANNRFIPREGKKTDPAHPAIFPTGIFFKMGDREKKLYDLIVRRFLACFAEEAVVEKQKVGLSLGGERYFAGGSRIVEKGWIDFYAPYASIEEKVLPTFKEGERADAEKVVIKSKKTRPPARYTKASIIQALESRGLGTKATRAQIVETLFKRGYVEGRSICVTKLGIAVCTTLEKYCPELLDEKFTRELEEKMDRIQTGEIRREEVIGEGKRTLTMMLAKFKEVERAVGLDLAAGIEGKKEIGRCKSCGAGLVVINTRKGSVFVGCTNYPKCRNTYPLPQKSIFKETGKTCEVCKTPVLLVIRGKTKFEMCLDPMCEKKKKWGWKNSQ
ncbi:MAG: DNA topoisomerase I [Candidatus Micrarchaeia archaeon]